MGKVTVIDGNPWKINLIVSAVIFAIGLAVAIGGKGSLDLVLMVVGVLIIIGATLSLVGTFNSASSGIGILISVVGIILGIALLAAPNFFRDITMAVLAIAISAMGVLYMLGSTSFPSTAVKIAGIAIGALMVIVGIIMLFNLSSAADVIMIVAGILLMAFGIVGMYSAISSR